MRAFLDPDGAGDRMQAIAVMVQVNGRGKAQRGRLLRLTPARLLVGEIEQYRVGALERFVPVVSLVIGVAGESPSPVLWIALP